MKDDWKKIISIEDGDNDNEIIITEEINLNHPDCPILLMPNNAYDLIMGEKSCH